MAPNSPPEDLEPTDEESNPWRLEEAAGIRTIPAEEPKPLFALTSTPGSLEALSERELPKGPSDASGTKNEPHQVLKTEAPLFAISPPEGAHTASHNPLKCTNSTVVARSSASTTPGAGIITTTTSSSDLEAGRPSQPLFVISSPGNSEVKDGTRNPKIVSNKELKQQLFAFNPGCHQAQGDDLKIIDQQNQPNSHVNEEPEEEVKTVNNDSEDSKTGDIEAGAAEGSPDEVANRVKKASQEAPDKKSSTGSGGRRKFRDFCSRYYCQPPPPQKLEMHKTILLASAFVFGMFCCAGLVLIGMQTKAIEREAQANALDLAKETGRWFSDALDNAMMPLFSLGQFVSQIEMFRKISAEMGPAGQEGSIPSREVIDGDVTHRDLTNSSCSDPQVIARFDEIAGNLKSNANMEGVLLQLFMNPQAVICRIHPLIVQEANFPPGVYYNATASLGLDFMTDPRLVIHGLNTLRSDDLVIAGPLTLRQCIGITDCHPVVEKAFVARLPITVKGYSMEHEGEVINRWGFVAATINWLALVEQSGMYERFERLGNEFMLSRIDRFFDGTEEKVILAESPRFDEVRGYRTIHIPVKESRNNWQIDVKYDLEDMTQWRKWSIPIVILVSFFIACLVYLVLVNKVKAQRALVNTERNMTAYFAHELRNPLAAIDCALESMPEDIPDAVKEMHQGMRLCSGLMSSIMNNLLDVRTMEEGKMQLHTNPIDLEVLVTELYKMQLPAVRSGVELSYKIETKGHKWVMGDKHRLQQVLTNVMSNAIKYTTSGSIVISVGWDKPSSQLKQLGWEKSSNNAKKLVRFQVADTGPGIPKDKQGELFQRFVRRSGAPGTGLGLAIAKHIVEVMEGTIHFESNPTVEPGAKCIALLPLEECPPPDQDFMVDESVTNASVAESLIDEPLTVFIVDDVQMNRIMLKRRLQKCVAPNCVITEASTGEEALDICSRSNVMFDVIIVDQYMEGAGGVMVGTDTIIGLRRSGQTSSIIIGCSGNDMDEEFKESGADLAWKKPLPSNAEIIRQFRRGSAR